MALAELEREQGDLLRYALDLARMPANRRLTVERACYTISSKLKSPGRPDC